MSDDWLEVDTTPPFHVSRHPRKMAQEVIRQHDGTAAGMRRELLLLKKQMNPSYRAYLDALIATGFHFSDAHKVLTTKGFVVDKSTLTRRRQSRIMGRAIEVAEALTLAEANVSGAKVLARVDKLSQYGLEDIPLRHSRTGEIMLDELGHPISIMRDPGLALKATELLGKNKKLWGNDDDHARVTVQIIDLAGTHQATPILDGEFTKVTEDEN